MPIAARITALARLTQQIAQISCPPCSTSVWDGDELVDVTTQQRMCLDGSFTGPKQFLGYQFDRALMLSARGTDWSVVYDNRGTKALLFKDGIIHRELNRSYYFAKNYDYPIVMAVIGAGRVAIVHCPRSYDVLEIEDAETGEILAEKRTPKMEFHSRLAVSNDGRYLLDAGWFWHPLCGLWVCELAGLLVEVSGQPAMEEKFSFGAEIDSAAFLGNDSIVISSTEEVINDEIPPTGIGPMKLGVWSLVDRRWKSTVDLVEPCGMMMPWRDWVISFYGCPKAIVLATGEVVHRWDEIYSGKQVGAIQLGDPPPPSLALDPQRGRFAVTGPNGITVVTLSANDQ